MMYLLLLLFLFALALDCYITLLKRDSLSDAHRAIGIDGYNLAVNKLFRLRHTTDNLIQVNYSGPSELDLVSEIEAIDARLSPKVFGELGGAAVARPARARARRPRRARLPPCAAGLARRAGAEAAGGRARRGRAVGAAGVRGRLQAAAGLRRGGAVDAGALLAGAPRRFPSAAAGGGR